jgi:two-component system chemotaxis response regulator CheB
MSGDTHVIALGASTGGPPAVRAVLSELQGVGAPILVVQHIHRDFVQSFCSWMQDNTGLACHVAREDTTPLAGHVYVAPGDHHLRLSAGRRLTLAEEPASNHRPSVDQLFSSVAEHAGSAGVAVLLTGMGEDGARGLMEVRRRGGVTIVQDAETSAVYGMPGAAAQSGAASQVLPLADIAPAVRRALDERADG